MVFDDEHSFSNKGENFNLMKCSSPSTSREAKSEEIKDQSSSFKFIVKYCDELD